MRGTRSNQLSKTTVEETQKYFAAKKSQQEYMKVRYMGAVPIEYIGKVSGQNYGIRNPRTNFYILVVDALHPESGVEIV